MWYGGIPHQFLLPAFHTAFFYPTEAGTWKTTFSQHSGEASWADWSLTKQWNSYRFGRQTWGRGHASAASKGQSAHGGIWPFQSITHGWEAECGAFVHISRCGVTGGLQTVVACRLLEQQCSSGGGSFLVVERQQLPWWASSVAFFRDVFWQLSLKSVSSALPMILWAI